MSDQQAGSFSLIPILQPYLIAQIVPFYLVGIVLAETVTYFRTFLHKDRWPLLAFVAFLAGCQTVYFALTVYALYEWAVVHWGDISAVLRIPPESLYASLMISFITTGVQCFFARRIWLLSGRQPYIPLLIVAMSVAGFGIGIFEIWGWYSVDLQVTAIDKMQSEGLALLLMSCACDIFITLAIAYYLRRASSSPEGPFLMGPLVKRIIIRTAETNALTSLVLILGVVFNYVKAAKSYGFLLQGLSPELYFLSALVSLNSRNAFRRRRRTTYEYQSEAATGGSKATPSGQSSKTFRIGRLRSVKKPESGASLTDKIQVTTDIAREVDEASSHDEPARPSPPSQATQPLAASTSIEMQPFAPRAA
ncbi:hypothetical protein JCM10908_006732 [Rhodotorula pacifica]|uniref:DUF6534 domain-containing protein n=1 Tax=Rhodotorula pacifica TaxID=1495444 RepID=UPI00317A12BC